MKMVKNCGLQLVLLQFNLPENPSAILSKTIKIRKFGNYTVFDTF